MSKNKNSNITLLPSAGGSILEQFMAFIEERPRKVSDIISFLSVQNARLIGMSGNLTKKMEDEIVEFAGYFNAEFGEITYEARMGQWGQEPLILRMAEHIEMQRWYREEEEKYDAMTDIAKHEAETLMETLMSFRVDKNISFANNDDGVQIFVPKTIYKEELPNYKRQMLYLCAEIIRDKGAAVVRLLEKNGTEKIFGIIVSPFGIWMPFDKEDMKAAHCKTPSGIELEPETGVEYTEIIRERV